MGTSVRRPSGAVAALTLGALAASVLLVAIPGTGGGTAPSTTIAEPPLPALEVGEVVFDGTLCHYQGADLSAVFPGDPVEVTLRNRGDRLATFAVVSFESGSAVGVTARADAPHGLTHLPEQATLESSVELGSGGAAVVTVAGGRPAVFLCSAIPAAAGEALRRPAAFRD